MSADLKPIVLDENSGLLLAEAARREMLRLDGLAAAARDAGDRDGWALYRIQVHRLHCIQSQISLGLERVGAPTAGCLAELADLVRFRRSRMPWSRANRSILEAQKRERDKLTHASS
jgi:hypothetical protein